VSHCHDIVILQTTMMIWRHVASRVSIQCTLTCLSSLHKFRKTVDTKYFRWLKLFQQTKKSWKLWQRRLDYPGPLLMQRITVNGCQQKYVLRHSLPKYTSLRNLGHLIVSNYVWPRLYQFRVNMFSCTGLVNSCRLNLNKYARRLLP